MKRRFILLVVAISLVGSFLGCDDDTTSPRFIAEEPFSYGSDVTTQTAFRLEGINGEVDVIGSDTATRVTATGVRRVTADTQQEADDRLPDIEIEMTSTSDEILIKTDHPVNVSGRNYIVDYSIVVPRDLAISLSSANGPISVDDAIGGLVIGIANGSITVQNVQGDASLTVANGTIVADVTLLSGSRVSAGTGNGDVRLEIPTQTSADVTAMAGNGKITVSGLVLTDLDPGSSRLSGRLGSGDGTIELSTGNGDIDLIGI